jgi:hypothetical protein
METLVLGCKCNNQEELIKCLTILKRCGLKWRFNREINIDSDINLFHFPPPITIFCYRDDYYNSNDFIITHSYTITKYGYTKAPLGNSNKIYYVTNMLGFVKFLECYRKWKNYQK